MGHGEPVDDPNLKGISRYINSQTIRGRANAAKLTIVSLIVGWQYYKHKPKPPAGPVEATFRPAEMLHEPEKLLAVEENMLPILPIELGGTESGEPITPTELT